MTTAGTPTLPIDDVDPAVLTDLLDFLDDFDQPQASSSTPPASSSAPPASSKSSAPDSPQSPSAATTSSVPTNNANATTSRGKKTRPRRLERYWIKKHELQALRDETTYLANKLELLRQCARSPAEVRVTSELGVSIRRVVHSHWKRLAAHEKAMREKAERQNAQLRALTQFQKQWNAGFQNALDNLAAVSTDLSNVPNIVVIKQKNASWREILVELFREACTFANIRPEVTLEKFDWSNMYTHFIPSKPMMEWNMTFPVPISDPISVGDKLWVQSGIYTAIQHMQTTSSLIQLPQVSPPRLHRICGFAYTDAAGRPLSSRMDTVFEMHKLKEAWILTATCSIFDSATSTLLVTATATTIITKSTASPGSCIVRAQYRVHDPDDLQTRGSISEAEGTTEIKQLAAHAKVAANNWAIAIRTKDYDTQRVLLQGSK